MTSALLGSIAETALKDNCQKWKKIAFSNAAIDRKKAQEAIYQFYSQSNTRPPSLFLWLDSPLQGALTVALIEQSLRERSYASVGAHSVEPSIAAHYQMIEERLQRLLLQRSDASFWSEARSHLQELVLLSHGQLAAHVTRTIRTTLTSRVHQGPHLTLGFGESGVGESVDARFSVNGVTE